MQGIGVLHPPRSAVAIVTFVQIKVLLQRLYNRIRGCSIRLKITVNMQQLWLSSPVFGSYLSNLGLFLASNNLVKIDNLEKSFYVQRDHPLGHLPSKSQCEKLSSLEQRYYFLKCAQFWPCYLIWDHLANLNHFLHNFYSISQGLILQLG